MAPVDVRLSEWECTLEAAAGSPEPQLRLGLHDKGLSRSGWSGWSLPVRQPVFCQCRIWRGAPPGQGDMQRLAAAGALAGLAGNRHQAAWLVMGMEPCLPLIEVVEEAPPRCRYRPKGRISGPTMPAWG